MSGEDDKSRPLSPESQGLPSKKPKEDEDSRSPPQASQSPGAGEGTQDEPMASGSRATGARPRTTTAKKASRSRSKSRSKSPLQRVAAFFKRSPKPKPPDEGGTPKDVKETTALWVRSKSMSPPPDPMETETTKRPSKKEKKKQKPEGPPVVMLPLGLPSTTVEVFERLPQDILDKEGIPKKPPLASVESMSTASGSSKESAKPSTSSGVVRPPPPTATPRPSDWAGPSTDEEKEGTEQRKLRPRRKEEPKK